MKELENSKGKRIIIMEPVRISVKKKPEEKRRKNRKRGRFGHKNKEEKECSEIFAAIANPNIQSIPHE